MGSFIPQYQPAGPLPRGNHLVQLFVLELTLLFLNSMLLLKCLDFSVLEMIY